MVTRGGGVVVGRARHEVIEVSGGGGVGRGKSGHTDLRKLGRCGLGHVESNTSRAEHQVRRSICDVASTRELRIHCWVKLVCAVTKVETHCDA